MPQNSIQFNRYLAAIISKQDGSYVWIDNVHTLDSYAPQLGSSCSMKFATTAWLTNTPAALHLTIYNPDIQILNVANSEGALINVIAGYLGYPSTNDKFDIIDTEPFSEVSTGAEMNATNISIIAAHNLKDLKFVFPDMQVSTIFNGQIAQAKPGRENGTDTYIEINAIDSDQVYLNGFVSTSIPAGSSQQSQMNQIAKYVQGAMANNKRLAQYSPYAVAFGNITDQATVVHRGQAHVGKFTDILGRYAANNNADFYMTNNTPTFLKRNDINPQYTRIISRSTGMIGQPQQTIDGIKVRTLLDPNIVQGIEVQITVDDIQQASQLLSNDGTVTNNQLSPINSDVVSPMVSGIAGKYKVLVATHSGHTRSNEWYTDITCFSRQQNSVGGGVPITATSIDQSILNKNLWY